MKNTDDEIQGKIDELERGLVLKRYHYKIAFDKVGGWPVAKKLHQEIKVTELQIELLKTV